MASTLHAGPIRLHRPNDLAVLPVAPGVSLLFPVGTWGEETAEVDLSDFFNVDVDWKEGEEAVVQIETKFFLEGVWFRNWMHFTVRVWVGDGVSQIPFEAKGTIVAGRKGLRSDNAVLSERLAAAIAPAFRKADTYLKEGQMANQMPEPTAASGRGSS